MEENQQHDSQIYGYKSFTYTVNKNIGFMNTF